jgi:UDP-N-acetyl-D-glucosamine dehydrogenase
MPAHVVDQVTAALNTLGKPVKGAGVLVLGLAYKADVDDSRESPSAELLKLLTDRGACVDYSDPHIPRFPAKRDYAFDLCSVDLTAESVAGYDCVVVATAHRAFGYDMVRANTRLIVDARGVYRPDNVRIFRG